MKKLSGKLIFTILLTGISLALFTGCIFMNQPKITEVLDEWTKVVKVVDAEYEYEYQSDCDGIVSLPSNKNVTVRYRIQNPVGLELGYGMEFMYVPEIYKGADFSDFQTFEKYYREKYYPEFDATDNSWKNENTWFMTSINSTSDIIELTLSKNLMYRMETDDIPFTLNPVITLIDKKSPGNPYINLVTANFMKLRVNSPPPQVQGGVIAVDHSTATSDVKNPNGQFENSYGKYVLCFNLPEYIYDQYGIQRDIENIYIDGFTAILNAPGKGGMPGTFYSRGFSLWQKDEEGNSIVGSINSYLPTNPPSELVSKNVYNNFDSGDSGMAGDGLPAAEFYESVHPIYLVDDMYSFRGIKHKYTVTLEDSKGLKSTVSIRTDSSQLKPVNMLKDNKKIMNPGYNYLNKKDVENGITLTLVQPYGVVGNEAEYVKDVEVVYEIYRLDENNRMTFIDYGYETNTIPLYLDEGDYYIKAYARKDEYLDSECRIWMLRIADWVEVKIDVITGYDGLYFGLDPDLQNTKIILDRKDLNFYNKQEELYYWDNTITRYRTIRIYPKIWNWIDEVWYSDEEVMEMLKDCTPEFYFCSEEGSISPEYSSEDYPYERYFKNNPLYDDEDPYTIYIPDVFFESELEGNIGVKLMIKELWGAMPYSASFDIIVN